MSREPKNNEEGFMYKLASFIVDKRNLIFLIVAIGLVFSVFSRNWVQVENQLSAYLPKDSETYRGLHLMEDEFITFGTAKVMLVNVTYDEAQAVSERLEAVDGVQSVTFDDTKEHYTNASALYNITFDYSETDEMCETVMNRVEDELSGYDIYVSATFGDTASKTLAQEIGVIVIIVAIVVVSVLILTSQTYAEVPVLLITFIAAALLNMGTNFLLGTISFVSNSVTSILQLALSLDYAVILCNRFKEEHQLLPVREAAIVALSKAIPEIGASSLTTVGGLAAMLFMQFKIGPDMGICLIKAIMFALLSVFVLMPGLLVLFGPLIDKTRHKDFVPKIPFVGKIDYATRFIVPVVFVVLAVLGLHFSNNCPYAYGYSTLETPKLNETQIAQNMVEDHFGSSNMVALVVPAGDYETEARLLSDLEGYEQVDHTMGLANVEALDGYMLADKLTPRQFAELAGLDYEAAQLVYAAYAASQEEYGQVLGNLATYRVPLIDMFLFVCDKIDEGLVTLDDEQTETLNDAARQMRSAQAQLCGTEYDRMLVYLTLPVSGDETYQFTDEIRELAQSYYPDGQVLVCGESTNEYDFEKSFSRDNTVVSVVSILIVLVVLLFTFKSAGMPILLIMVIQGSIWINFSVPTITGTGLFFMSYLVVSSIQMGANIDYAIVIASRYQELKQEMPHKQAMIETLNFAFPTIITSGTILATAGILIGQMTSEATIVGIGQSLGRGTILSMFLVLFVLPQILLIGGDIADKTSFSMPKAALRRREASGRVYVDGLVSGEIHGSVSGIMRANVDGAVDLRVISGNVEQVRAKLPAGEGSPGDSSDENKEGEGSGDENA